jgi:sorting nexin-1/2
MQLRTREAPILEVKNPTLIKNTATKHHTYTIRGTDAQGAVEVVRRYKEFNHLREVLYLRFPGLYVPPMPPK